jgi:hypothetical protein
MPPARRPGTRYRRPLAITLSIVAAGGFAVAMVLLAAGPSANDVGQRPRTCTANPRMALKVTQLPGFVSFVSFPDARLPGSHGLPGHELPMYRQFQCGVSYGFLAKIVLTGKYRAQDDALARSLHYRVGKWPLVPFVGDIVSQRPHLPLEIYEGIYEFGSTQAAAQWLQTIRYTPQPPHGLAAPGLPGGFIARTGVTGPDDGQHEHEVGVNGRVGSMVLTLGFQGGRSLSWADVRQLWKAAWSQFQRGLSGRDAV